MVPMVNVIPVRPMILPPVQLQENDDSLLLAIFYPSWILCDIPIGRTRRGENWFKYNNV